MLIFVIFYDIIFEAPPVIRQAVVPSGSHTRLLIRRAVFALHFDMKGGLLMITWLELFTFCLVIIGVVSLVIQVYKKK
jgi:hypothetical protein